MAERARQYIQRYGALVFSVFSLLEIVRGFERLSREAALQRALTFVATHQLLEFDAASAEIAGRIDARLANVGQPIGRIDPMIAAIAVSRGLTLVTGNTRHYERVIGLGFDLQLDDWRA